jgi:protein-disulfide isomerase
LSQGTPETKLSIISEFDSTAFSAIAGASKQTTIVPNPELYIRPHNPRFGVPSAPITIIAFIDFECPYCRRAFTDFEAIREKYSPIVQVIFKHFPLSSVHPNAVPAAIAAQCAAEQNLFWEYYGELFASSVLSTASYTTYAERIGIKTSQFQTCQASTNTERLISQDVQDGITIGVRGTPSYLVNGILIEGVITETNWDRIILELFNQNNE